MRKCSSVVLAGILLSTVGPNLMFFSTAPDFASAYEFEDNDFIFVADIDSGFVYNPGTSTERPDYRGMKGVVTYEVQKGDTLSEIASQFGISSSTIMNANPGLWSSNYLRVGQGLTFPMVDGIIKKVSGSDTVKSMAKKYSIDEEEIRKHNDLEGDKLIAGAYIVLPGAKEIARTTYVAQDLGAVSNMKYVETGKKLIWPTDGKISQGYRRGHYALDISNRGRPAIFAADSGTIIKSSYGWNGGYGNHIIIDHGNGMQTLYAHLQNIAVKVGDEIARGQVIGKMGNTGRVYGATGIHLHFEVRIGNVKRNPLAYL
jgi:murein DD-endopeptidase MepM/ murein hydrolase activator NlpD